MPLKHIEAEQTLIGAVMINNRILDRVAEFLRPEYFYDPVHQKIFAAIVELMEQGEVAGPVALKAHFEQNDELGEIGGTAYIAKLAFSVETTEGVSLQAQLVRELYFRRRMFELGSAIMRDATERSSSISRRIEQARNEFSEIAEAMKSFGIKGGLERPA
jgi:replicative DNA helicase